MMDKEAFIQIRKCMTSFRSISKLVVQLREMEGFSYNEIAVSTGYEASIR